MPEDSQRPHIDHDLEHVGKVIRQKYPEVTTRQRNKRERRVRILNRCIMLACIIVLVATPTAIYFIANGTPLYGFAALVTALSAAFGPKIYTDFIQGRRRSPSATTRDQQGTHQRQAVRSVHPRPRESVISAPPRPPL